MVDGNLVVERLEAVGELVTHVSWERSSRFFWPLRDESSRIYAGRLRHDMCNCTPDSYSPGGQRGA